MKGIFTALVFLLSGASLAPALAQSASAEANANCNASFKASCPPIIATQSSTTVVNEAPLPLLAGSPFAALVLAGVVYALRRRKTS